MKVEWKESDTNIPFEQILQRIREGKLENAKVSFYRDAQRKLFYTIEALMSEEEIRKALGFQPQPPTER